MTEKPQKATIENTIRNLDVILKTLDGVFEEKDLGGSRFEFNDFGASDNAVEPTEFNSISPNHYLVLTQILGKKLLEVAGNNENPDVELTEEQKASLPKPGFIPLVTIAPFKNEKGEEENKIDIEGLKAILQEALEQAKKDSGRDLDSSLSMTELEYAREALLEKFHNPTEEPER